MKPRICHLRCIVSPSPSSSPSSLSLSFYPYIHLPISISISLIISFFFFLFFFIYTYVQKKKKKESKSLRVHWITLREDPRDYNYLVGFEDRKFESYNTYVRTCASKWVLIGKCSVTRYATAFYEYKYSMSALSLILMDGVITW